MLLQEGGERVFVGLGLADFESWMSEVHLRLASLPEQTPGYNVAARGVVFKLLQGRLIEVSMRVGVIAEIEARLKFAFDHEANGGYVILPERLEDTTIPAL